MKTTKKLAALFFVLILAFSFALNAMASVNSQLAGGWGFGEGGSGYTFFADGTAELLFGEVVADNETLEQLFGPTGDVTPLAAVYTVRDEGGGTFLIRLEINEDTSRHEAIGFGPFERVREFRYNYTTDELTSLNPDSAFPEWPMERWLYAENAPDPAPAPTPPSPAPNPSPAPQPAPRTPDVDRLPQTGVPYLPIPLLASSSALLLALGGFLLIRKRK